MILTSEAVELDPHADRDVPGDDDEPDDAGLDGFAEHAVQAVMLCGVLILITQEDLQHKYQTRGPRATSREGTIQTTVQQYQSKCTILCIKNTISYAFLVTVLINSLIDNLF